MRTRQQKWSLDAQRKVAGFAKGDDKVQGKLKTYCMKMPALIQRSGAVQALAFVISRGGEGERFAKALAQTYGRDDGRTLLAEAQTTEGLSSYLALTRDLLDIAAWYRRFAQIELAGVKQVEEESDS